MIRAARHLSESKNYAYARAGKWLLQLLQEINDKKDQEFTSEQINELKDRFFTEVKQYEDLDGEAKTLIKRVTEEFDSVIYFMSYPVDPTNNFAERQLRKFVEARKCSLGVTSENGTYWLERAMSLYMTSILRKQSFFKALHEGLDCYFKGVKPDLGFLDPKNVTSA